MEKERKILGILGGMGPLATADLYRKVVLFTDAENDNEHLRTVIDSNTAIPDRTAAILRGGKDPLPEMRSARDNLARAGADCIIMPCNTAHYFLPALEADSPVPFLSMLEATAKACAAKYPGKTAAILATRGTLQTGLYHRALEKEEVAYLEPDENEKDALMFLIYEVVKASRPVTEGEEVWTRLLEGLRRKGADYFILGCTELPILAEELPEEGPFIDPTAEIAKAAIRFCGYRVRE